MTLSLVLIATVVAIAVVLSQRLRLRVAWSPDARLIHLRYLMLNLRRDSRHARESDEAAAAKVAKARRRKTRKAAGRKRWRVSWRRLIGLLPEAMGAVWKSAGFLVRRCRLDQLTIDGPVGTSDPAVTGMLWGAVSALKETIVTPGVAQVRVWPEFVDGRTAITFDATLSVRAGALLAAPVLLVWYLPKRALWHAFRQSRRSGRSGVPDRTMPEEGEKKP